MSKRRVVPPLRKRVSTKERAASLLAQRDQLMSELAHARLPSPLVKSVATLLTRFWSGANWDAREDLVRAACWAMRVGSMHFAAGLPKARTQTIGFRGVPT